MGEAPELDNYFVAAGLNSIGILTGGGIGRLVASWIMTGKPDMDVSCNTCSNPERDHLHVFMNYTKCSTDHRPPTTDHRLT